MQGKVNFMFYVSALVAIAGAVGYQYFIKRVPVTLNPIISVISVYAAVLVLGMLLIPLFPPEGGLLHQIRQLGWIQLAVAGGIFLMEFGFLLMYRYGWNLSTGNLVTGVIINIALFGLGVFVLGEKVNLVNMVGIALSIVGVALISYRP